MDIDKTEPTGPQDGDVFFGRDDEPVIKKDDAPSIDVAMAEQKTKIDMLTKQLEQMQMANMTLMAQPQAQSQMPQAPAVPETPETLPDVYDDSEGFAKALSERIVKQVESTLASREGKQNAAQSQEGKYNDLWEAFQATHKDYAEDKRKVRYAANIAAENAAKRGLDVERYMFMYRDKFMEDVVGVMNDVFGMKKKEQEKEPAPTEPQRTEGLFGGLDTGGKPAAAMDKPEDDPFSDIREWQTKTGFYR